MELGPMDEKKKLASLVLKTKKWGRNLRYWVGMEGSRYGITLNYGELTQLLTQPHTAKIGDLITVMQPDGTIKIGREGSQRQLTTTPQNLQMLLDQNFITLKAGDEWGKPILKPLGWEMETTPKTITFVKTRNGEMAKIHLYLREKTKPTFGADLNLGYTESYNLIGRIETPETRWGSQMKRWARRELRTISCTLLNTAN